MKRQYPNETTEPNFLYRLLNKRNAVGAIGLAMLMLFLGSNILCYLNNKKINIALNKSLNSSHDSIMELQLRLKDAESRYAVADIPMGFNVYRDSIAYLKNSRSLHESKNDALDLETRQIEKENAYLSKQLLRLKEIEVLKKGDEILYDSMGEVYFDVVKPLAKAKPKPKSPPPPHDVADFDKVSNVPDFPWPIPLPSVRCSFAKKDFPNASDFHQIDAVICKALDEAHYDLRSYFKVPSGFAIVTQLEQTDEKGEPSQDPYRWSLEAVPLTQLSGSFILNYLGAVFLAHPLHYRCTIFVVTDKALQFDTNKDLTPKDANGLAKLGSDGIPEVLASMPINDELKVTVLIYEFKKPENSNVASTVGSGGLTAEQHLKKSGLWQPWMVK
jgi:hypothetical protein